MDEKIKELQKMIDESHSIVFFGGAGVSTESGIPDFRSQDGLYRQEWKYPPETIISRSFFDANPQEFYRFYRKKLIIKGVQPNITHYKLAELEAAGKLSAVVTQNIDGLHQLAGSKVVWELHGSTLRNFCMKCGKSYDIDFIAESENSSDKLPRCECGGLVKPDVVLYEEGLDDKVINGAVDAIANADMLIIGGTSLVVYPAAGLIRYFKGKHLVLINKSETQADASADLVIHDSLGKVFEQIKVSKV
ncbi:MAG: NAD-dependent protein deacylase [Treponema sp.]|nr:NAD-dependent protein deacylase [Treponema sp.]